MTKIKNNWNVLPLRVLKRGCTVSIRIVTLVMLLCLTYMTAPPACAQNEFESGHFKTSDGVELHYLEAGTGPTIVFVPGWKMPAEIWESQLRHFASTHHVVALDPRGQGRSEKTTEGHYLSRRGQDIGELIEHLGTAPAVVVGWSFGMLELLTYAQELGTDALRAAVLVDFYIGLDEEPGQPHPFAPGWRDYLTNLQMDRSDWTSEWVREALFQSDQPEEYFNDITRVILKTPTNTAVTILSNHWLIEQRDWRPFVDELNLPVLYAVAEPFSEQAENAKARRPDLRVEVFEGAGHALFVDQPERFNRVLGKFLEAVPEP